MKYFFMFIVLSFYLSCSKITEEQTNLSTTIRIHNQNVYIGNRLIRSIDSIKNIPTDSFLHISSLTCDSNLIFEEFYTVIAALKQTSKDTLQLINSENIKHTILLKENSKVEQQSNVQDINLNIDISDNGMDFLSSYTVSSPGFSWDESNKEKIFRSSFLKDNPNIKTVSGASGSYLTKKFLPALRKDINTGDTLINISNFLKHYTEANNKNIFLNKKWLKIVNRTDTFVDLKMTNKAMVLFHIMQLKHLFKNSEFILNTLRINSLYNTKYISIIELITISKQLGFSHFYINNIKPKSSFITTENIDFPSPVNFECNDKCSNWHKSTKEYIYASNLGEIGRTIVRMKYDSLGGHEIYDNSNFLKQIYNVYLCYHSPTKGEVSIEIVKNLKGKTTKVKLLKSTLHSPELEEWIIEGFKLKNDFLNLNNSKVITVNLFFDYKKWNTASLINIGAY